MTKHQLLVLARHLRFALRSYVALGRAYSPDAVAALAELDNAANEAAEILAYVERQKGSDE